MKNWKIMLFWAALMLAYITTANAYAMAVSINDLYLQNNTDKAKTVTIQNLSKNNRRFKIAPKDICYVYHRIMFQPFAAERNSFVIMVSSAINTDPIVIDKGNTLTLAHESLLKMPYSGNVRSYNFMGYCGDKLQQYQFLHVLPHTNPINPPNFNLINCSNKSNFVYSINERSINLKDQQKIINFNNINKCISLEK